MMAENVIETNKSNDIDVDKIQARNVQTFAQKLKQYKITLLHSYFIFLYGSRLLQLWQQLSFL